jgi:hypothetical protein
MRTTSARGAAATRDDMGAACRYAEAASDEASMAIVERRRDLRGEVDALNLLE